MLKKVKNKCIYFEQKKNKLHLRRMRMMTKYILPLLLILFITISSAKISITHHDGEKKVQKSITPVITSEHFKKQHTIPNTENANIYWEVRRFVTSSSKKQRTAISYHKNRYFLKNQFNILYYPCKHNHKPFHNQAPFYCRHSCDYFIFDLHRVIV